MLSHPLLRGIEHGFGQRDLPAPAGLLRPRQVHGIEIATAGACRADPAPEADGVVSAEAGVPIGIVTADCVPVLLASEGGGVVAAVHAGWRGLAGGVVAQGVDAVRRKFAGSRILAAIGPHIGPCCYEVDAPVLDALGDTLGPLDRALCPSRPGHAVLDLGALVAVALTRSGLAPTDIATLNDCCTRCNPERFHSYRRDGPRAGRLVHFITAREP